VAFNPISPGRVLAWYVKHVEPTAGENDGTQVRRGARFCPLVVSPGPDAMVAIRPPSNVCEHCRPRRLEELHGFWRQIAGEVDACPSRPFSGGRATQSVKLSSRTMPWKIGSKANCSRHHSPCRQPDPFGRSPREPGLRFADNRTIRSAAVGFYEAIFAHQLSFMTTQITVSKRLIDGKQTITVLETKRTPRGNFLPRSSRAILGEGLRTGRSEMCKLFRAGGAPWALPSEHTFTMSSAVVLGSPLRRLSEHKLGPRNRNRIGSRVSAKTAWPGLLEETSRVLAPPPVFQRSAGRRQICSRTWLAASLVRGQSHGQSTSSAALRDAFRFTSTGRYKTRT